MINVGIYTRISTDDQSDYSLDKQERDCRAEAARRGWEVYHVYTDEGISAKNDKRPALRQLQADIVSRKVQAIIVHKTDRLMRNLRLLLGFIEIVRDHNASFISMMENIDLTTPMGWAMFQVQGVFSELYINNLREETRKGLTEKAQQGYWVGGICPYGYRRADKDTIVPGDAAPIVRDMFQLYASGEYSYTRLADEMNRRVPQRSFRTEGVRDILSNRSYCGYVSSGGVEYPGKHEPLVSEEVWQRCATIRRVRMGGFRSSEQKKPPSNPVGLLLTNGYCAICDQRLWQHTSGVGHLRRGYYKCAGMSRRNCAVKLQRVDLVDAQIMDLVTGFVWATEWQDEVLRRLKGRIVAPPVAPVIDRRAIEQKLERLSEAYADGNLSRESYTKRCAELKKQLEQAPVPETQPELDLGRAVELLSTMGHLLERATIEDRRNLITMLFERFWIRDTTIHAVQPKMLYGVLWKEMRQQYASRCRASGKRALST